MKFRVLISLLTLCVLSLCGAPSATAQQKKTTRELAKPGDKVWVIVNPVKADKRVQFEHFVSDIFWPTFAKLGPEEQHVFRQTRVLNAVRPEADGTYAYLFIMDPVIPGASYDIEAVLKKAYGPEKGAEHYKLYTESLAGAQKTYSVLETKN
ncbi:hypothetical protein [Hymenobacter sp. BT730]|uniref:hypothetical protein n=1 Tax=Hymenobacter sp. BT730 TaxID=3063332 RepID=UPI0026E0B91D|nr:hypothetical protein [Hymenobacter sp. BT730]